MKTVDGIKTLTYYYTVEEVSGELKNMTHDTNKYTIEVVVTYVDANEDGTEDTVEVSYSYGYLDENNVFTVLESGSDKLTEYGRLKFTNVYDPDDAEVETKADFGLTKTISGREWLDTDEFTFTLTAGSDSTPMPNGETGGTATVTATKENQTIDFGTITYSKVGTYTYTATEEETNSDSITIDSVIREITVTVTYNEETESLVAEVSISGDTAGVTYDKSKYKVVIKLTDNGDGTISASTSITLVTNADGETVSESAESIAFKNTYSTTDATLDSTSIRVAKHLSGRAGQTDETFTFKISDAGNSVAALDENLMPESNTITVEASTTEDEIVYSYFGEITFTHPGIYYYTISEVSNDEQLIGTWSKAEYTVTITVTDNGNGTLTAEITSFKRTTSNSGVSEDVTIGNNTARFWNYYDEPEPEKDVFEASDTETSINGDAVSVGDELTYVVSWTNTAIDSEGNATTAKTITVTDTIPNGTVYTANSAEATLNDENADDCVITFLDADGEEIEAVTEDNASSVAQIKWEFTDVAKNEVGTVSFSVTVIGEAEDNTITNSAEVTIGENEPVTTNVTENYVPEKEIVSIGGENADNGDSISVGDEIEYEISYFNYFDEATTVVITDELDEGVDFVSAGTETLTSSIDEDELTDDAADIVTYLYNEETHTVTWTIFNASACKSSSVTLTVKVNENAVEVSEDETEASVENDASVQIGTENSANTNIVTNPVNPETVEVSGSKTWDDSDDKDGKRPESITIRLYADGVEVDSVTVTEEDDWSYSFSGLDKYSNGAEIVYSITEDAVEDYTTTYNGFDVQTHIRLKQKLLQHQMMIPRHLTIAHQRLTIRQLQHPRQRLMIQRLLKTTHQIRATLIRSGIFCSCY